MSIAKPGPVIRRWSVTGLSMNGQTEYGLQIEAMLEATAREMFRTYAASTASPRPESPGWSTPAPSK